MNNFSNCEIETFEFFEKKSTEWTYIDFETHLEEKMGDDYANYQDAKSAIIKAHRSKMWPNTVKRYTLTNYKAFGNSSIFSVFRDILNSMSEQDKKAWDI